MDESKVLKASNWLGNHQRYPIPRVGRPDTSNYRLSSQGLFHSHDQALQPAQSFAMVGESRKI